MPTFEDAFDDAAEVRQATRSLAYAMRAISNPDHNYPVLLSLPQPGLSWTVLSSQFDPPSTVNAPEASDTHLREPLTLRSHRSRLG